MNRPLSNRPLRIYLDHHTVTRPASSAIEKMLPFLREQWGAIEAPHQMGQELFPAVDRAASTIYDLLGAGVGEHFAFTSSGAEAINQVLFSTYFDCSRETGRNHFLTTAIEGASMLMPMKRLEQLGCASKILPVNQYGQLTREVLEEAIRPRAALLSIAWANSLTGVIQPIEEIAQICREKEVHLHVDVTTVLGKIFFRFQDSGIDYLTFEGGGIHAPKGTGGLLSRKEIPLSPFIMGSPHFNVAGFVGLAAAIEALMFRFDHYCTEIVRLRDRFEEAIVQGYPEATVLFQSSERLPNVSVIAFPGVLNEALLYALHRQGVYATMGGGNVQELGHVLSACGICKELGQTALSFALSHETTQEQIDDAARIVVDVACRLRKVTGSLV